MKRYYADTYALVEILKGNPVYQRYAEGALLTSEFNILELAYALVRDYGSRRALEIIRAVRTYVTIIRALDEDCVRASMLRLELRKRGKNLSLIDALGYAIAKRLSIPFLTGDQEFENLEGVEYVR